jgi:hypothetical protein
MLMKKDHSSYYFLIAAIIVLLLGVTNYYLLNPNIVLFHWAGMQPAKSVMPQHSVLTLFLKGYFSDIVWCTALCLVISYISKHVHLRNSDKLLILLTPFLSELGQYLAFIPGTFDWFDILAYLTVILLYNSIFPLLFIPFKMKSHIVVPGIVAIFLFMVFASAPQRKTTTYRRQPDPCVKHAALTYSPVLVQINIDGSYTMKDLSGAQRSGQLYFMDALTATNTYKYKLAQGETPNLNIYITVNTDSYQHYGATVKLYVYDDNTWFNMSSNYVEPTRLFDDIAAKINSFVMYGWQHGDCK